MAASRMAIAERNLSLLLASDDAVKVHIGAELERFADMDGARPGQESTAAAAYFKWWTKSATARRVSAGFSSCGM